MRALKNIYVVSYILNKITKIAYYLRGIVIGCFVIYHIE